MVLYVKGNSKNMVNTNESHILHLSKQLGWSTVTKVMQQSNPVNDYSKQNTFSDRTKRQYSLKPKDDRTYMASGWMTVWRLGYRGS